MRCGRQARLLNGVEKLPLLVSRVACFWQRIRRMAEGQLEGRIQLTVDHSSYD